MTLHSCVALFVYNRRTYLPAILERIRCSHPTKFYVFGDGPKDDPADRVRCAAVRNLIAEIEWPFPAQLTFAPTNIGIYRRFVSGINEVFTHEERAIFLDDDIELSQSFFPFADWLLDVYEPQDQVAMISGVNQLSLWPTAGATCFFTKLGNAQAWATWRRAWGLFSGAHDLWSRPETQAIVAKFLGDRELFAWCAAKYERGRKRDVDNWDYQWALARHARQALCAVPAKNLVIHRGRGPSATHVTTRNVLDAIAERHEIAEPFRAPAALAADDRFDRLYFEATQNKLSAPSARWLAKRLMACRHNLLAIAVLRNSAATGLPDPETEALIAEAASASGLARFPG
jgi:hypothetical protein